jgi:hypothetical protein
MRTVKSAKKFFSFVFAAAKNLIFLINEAMEKAIGLILMCLGILFLLLVLIIVAIVAEFFQLIRESFER